MPALKVFKIASKSIASFTLMKLIVIFLSSIVCIPNTNIQHPTLRQFQQFESRFDQTRILSLYWSILNPGTANETLYGALVFNGTAFTNFYDESINLNDGMWYSIGLGYSMATAEFITVFCGDGHTTANEQISSGGYGPPVDSPRKILTNVSPQSIVDNIAIVVFSRPTKPNDGYHRNLDVTKPVPHVWAYDPRARSNQPEGWNKGHLGYMGTLQIKYQTGESQLLRTVSVGSKRLHGASMAFIWMILFPISTYFTRYFKFLPIWLNLHTSLQAIGGSVGVVASALFIISILPDNLGSVSAFSTILRPHSILGLTLVTFTLIQGRITTI